MNFRIVLNDNADKVKEIRAALKANEGYCPCKMVHTEDNKCMCKEFRDMVQGECYCGLYRKELIKED